MKPSICCRNALSVAEIWLEILLSLSLSVAISPVIVSMWHLKKKSTENSDCATLSVFFISWPDRIICFATTHHVHWAARSLRLSLRSRRFKVLKSSSYGALPIPLFRHFCRKMYHLASPTTDSRTDRPTENITIPIADHTCSSIG